MYTYVYVFAIAKGEFAIAKDEFAITKDEFAIAKDEFERGERKRHYRRIVQNAAVILFCFLLPRQFCRNSLVPILNLV